MLHTDLIILCGRQRLWTEGFFEVRSLSYLVHQYLFIQASSLRLLIVRSSSCDVVELCQRVLNFDESDLWIGQSAPRGELYASRLYSRLYYLQCRSPTLERTIRAQCRSTQVSFTCCFDKYVLQWEWEKTLSMVLVEQHRSHLSSQELALLLDTYVLFWDDAFVAPCFHPSENRATCYSTYR